MKSSKIVHVYPKSKAKFAKMFFSKYQRVLITFCHFPEYDSHNNDPQRCPGIYKYVNLHGKRDFLDMVKDFEIKGNILDYPGVLSVVM